MTPPTGPTDPFSFVHDGRTFTCCAEASPASARGVWWWFAVSTESYQRHAPFRVAAGDTAENVRDRIIAYFDDRLARRSAPSSPWGPRGTAHPPAPLGTSPPG